MLATKDVCKTDIACAAFAVETNDDAKLLAAETAAALKRIDVLVGFDTTVVPLGIPSP